MIRISVLRHIVTVSLGVMLCSLLTSPAAGGFLPCSQCGPGPHWVWTCSGGRDSISDHSALVGIDMNLDCVQDISLILYPCAPPNNFLIVNRSAPYGVPDLDTINTEIISMCLTGSGVTLKAGLGQGAIVKKSLGKVIEKAVDSTSAASYFDVFFEVNLGGGMFVYNHIPLRIESNITCIPPRAKYIKPVGCLELFTDPDSGQGMHVANLVTADHSVNLRIIPTLSEWALIIFSVLLLALLTYYVIKRRRLARAVV